MIYLISRDGYPDTLVTDYYAVDEEGIKLLITKEIKEFHNCIPKNIKIYSTLNPFGIEEKKVSFEYFCSSLEEWVTESYLIVTINRIGIEKSTEA